MSFVIVHQLFTFRHKSWPPN